MNRRHRNRKEPVDILIVKVLLVGLTTLLIFFGVALFNMVFSPEPVQAVGNCREGEVRVKHFNTGKCNCLPANAVAHPWEPDDSCGETQDPTQPPIVAFTATNKPLEPTAKPTKRIKSTADPFVPTSTPVNTLVVVKSPTVALQTFAPTYTNVLVENATQTPISALIQIIPESTQASTCDTCEIEKQNADSLKRIADALERLTSWLTHE